MSKDLECDCVGRWALGHVDWLGFGRQGDRS